MQPANITGPKIGPLDSLLALITDPAAVAARIVELKAAEESHAASRGALDAERAELNRNLDLLKKATEEHDRRLEAAKAAEAPLDAAKKALASERAVFESEKDSALKANLAAAAGFSSREKVLKEGSAALDARAHGLDLAAKAHADKVAGFEAKEADIATRLAAVAKAEEALKAKESAQKERVAKVEWFLKSI